MQNSDLHKHKVESIAQLKESISELYRIYSEKFPENSQFWRDLSRERKMQAGWIHSTMIGVTQGDGKIDPERFNDEVIQSTLTYVDQLKKSALNTPISCREAISMTIHLEDAMIGKQFFEIFKNDSSEFNIVTQQFKLALYELKGELQNLLRK